MTDKELLKLAAKAAALEVWTDIDGDLYTSTPELIEKPWDPLGDDGDALRLAVILSININFGRYDEGSVYTFDFNGRFSDCEEEGDPYAAARRAIVRAAAEIGKNK